MRVDYHWDKLRTCLVGRAYPPEFFSWVHDRDTRNRLERLVQETEEDYQNLINLLTHKFGVQVLRPELPNDADALFQHGKWVPPPTAPRDYFVMIGDRFFVPGRPNAHHAWRVFSAEHGIDSRYPDAATWLQQSGASQSLRQAWQLWQARDQAHLDTKLAFYHGCFDEIQRAGNDIVYTNLDFINGCFVTRLGQDLYFGTQSNHDDKALIKQQVDHLFPDHRNRIVDSQGHGDATYCPVAPGLIISLYDVPTYSDTFPDWEVVYLPPSDYAHMREFEASMKLNKGRWFIPGFEQDPGLINTIEHYFSDWVGQVSETVFDVNILIVDPKNIVVSAPNPIVERACARYGVTMHVVPFRHKYFWDCGIHCITNDLDRG
jgi:hypothetical protein